MYRKVFANKVFDRKVVVITGGCAGIGRALAMRLAQAGARLVIFDLQQQALDSLVQHLADHHNAEALGVLCDVADAAAVERAMALTVERFGGIDVLVNNAAFVGTSNLQGWVTDFEQQTVETWRRALEVNLTAAFDLVKGLAPLLKQSKGGSIINIGSTYAFYGPDYSLYEGTAMGNPAAYAASKGGLIQLTRWLATTLAPQVRVNAISPGGVFRNQPASFIERYKARTPLRRMAVEDDLRGAIAYLSGELSGYVTGQNLAVDGGWGVW